MATPLSGKLALVTGASRGIGAATAEALGKAGAHVILTARTAGGLEEVEERIHAAGGTAAGDRVATPRGTSRQPRTQQQRRAPAYAHGESSGRVCTSAS